MSWVIQLGHSSARRRLRRRRARQGAWGTPGGPHLNWPAMLGDVRAIPFRIADPALRDRAERVRLRGRLRRIRDGLGALDLEAEVVDAPRLIRARDQRDAHEAVGEINRAVGPAGLLLQAQDLLVGVGN